MGPIWFAANVASSANMFSSDNFPSVNKLHIERNEMKTKKPKEGVGMKS